MINVHLRNQNCNRLETVDFSCKIKYVHFCMVKTRYKYLGKQYICTETLTEKTKYCQWKISDLFP